MTALCCPRSVANSSQSPTAIGLVVRRPFVRYVPVTLHVFWFPFSSSTTYQLPVDFLTNPRMLFKSLPFYLTPLLLYQDVSRCTIPCLHSPVNVLDIIRKNGKK